MSDNAVPAEEETEGGEQPALTAEEEQAAAQAFDSVFDDKAEPEGQAAVEATSGSDDPKGQAAAAPAQGAEEATDKAAAPAQAAAASAEDPWAGVAPALRAEFEKLSTAVSGLEGLNQRLKTTEGRVGAIHAAMDAAKAAAKAGQAAPTQDAIAAATASGEKWARLKEDFPDWADAMEERFAAERGKATPAVDVEALRKDINAVVATNAEQARASAVQQARELVRLDSAVPDWETTINTPEFKGWMLEGGPSMQAYLQMKALERTNPAQANAMVSDFARQHPAWWADRGHAVFDQSATAAIGLLKSYETHAKTKAKASTRQDRLRAAVPATQGGAGGRPTGMSDRDAEQAAFNAVFDAPS